MQESEIIFVKDQKLVPLDRFERVFRLAEIDPEDATLVAGTHNGWVAVALFHPFAISS